MGINRKQGSFDSSGRKRDSNKQNKSAQQPKLEQRNSSPQNSSIQLNTQVSASLNQNSNQFEPMQTERSSQIPWWQTWQLWGLCLVLLSGGIGFTATTLLLKLPKEQNCARIFWPVASASIRLYCAQVEAEQNNVQNLLEAIALVEVLPNNHPLRGEINRNVERWATDILDIGETKFQDGDLEGAIAVAKQIPEYVQAYQVVEDKIESWQSIWSKGEETYAKVEQQLRNANWNEAFVWAVSLTNSSNQFWATTKYQETIDKINIAQEERSTLDIALTTFRKGGLDNLFAALDTIEEFDQNSYAYQDAQDLKNQAKDQLLKTTQKLLDDQDWRKLLKVATRVPNSLQLQSQVKDWRIIASAGSSANLDTVFGLEEAIAEAEKLEPESPLYQRAQRLISRWKLEIEDVAHLSKAKQLAQAGGIESYQNAIAEARLIPVSNPRYRDAQAQIREWRNQIHIIEDQPIINRARQLAYASNVDAWQRAIAEAKLISSNSPLYPEARKYISEWRANIQRVEDRPLLDRAIALANTNNYVGAIDTAQRIKAGRALYAEAQAKISSWRQEIQAIRYFGQARAIAERGTPEALAQAIKIAKKVSSSTTPYSQVIQNMNRWSSQILGLAQSRALYSLEEAIAIARLIPSGTVGYQQAQSQIKNWQERLQPSVIQEDSSLEDGESPSDSFPFTFKKPAKQQR